MALNVFMFVPAFGQIISTTTFLTTHAIQQKLAQKSIGGGVSSLSFPDIAELRSMVLTIWYDTMPNVSHLLFIDADMGFDPDMVLDMLMFDEPIVGTIYRQRKESVSWAGSGTGDAITQRRGNFMLVEGVGMGCTLIRRDVVTKMLEQMPELVDTRLHLHPAGETLKQAGTTRLIRAFEKLDLPDRGIVSEDLSFCIRWNRCGGQVWAAVGYKISHVGPHDFNGRYLDMVEQAEAQAFMQQQIRVAQEKAAADQFKAQAQAAAAQATPVSVVDPTLNAMDSAAAAAAVSVLTPDAPSDLGEHLHASANGHAEPKKSRRKRPEASVEQSQAAE